jgi:magnesium chelatase family protein
VRLASKHLGTADAGVEAARERGFRRLLVPAENAREAAVVEDIAVYAVGTLNDTVGPPAWVAAARAVPQQYRRGVRQAQQVRRRFRGLRSQEFAKRALAIAAADGHNLLTMLTKRTNSPGFSKRSESL